MAGDRRRWVAPPPGQAAFPFTSCEGAGDMKSGATTGFLERPVAGCLFVLPPKLEKPRAPAKAPGNS